MQEQPGGERRARPVLDHDLPRAGDFELAEEPGGAVPTTGSRALKQAAPAVSPELAAIVAAVDASISAFCWMTEHPAKAQRMTRMLTVLHIISLSEGVGSAFGSRPSCCTDWVFADRGIYPPVAVLLAQVYG